MSSEKKKILLICIFFLAFIFRFYKIGVNPPSLNWDEVSIGYNAYSIAETFRDEHSRFLPINYFAAFGDYKPPVYIYLAVPFIKVLGLNALAVRLPSAILGFLTVVLTYFLVKELFCRRSLPECAAGVTPLRECLLPLASAFVLAVSPWHILVSRAAFEANAATFFIVLGVLLFWWGINQKPLLLLFSSFSFVSSLYTFNSPRLFLPFFLPVLGFVFKDELLRIKKWAIVATILGIILLLPLLPHLLSKEGQLRFKEVNIFTDSQPVIEANQRSGVDQNVWWARVIHNRRIGYALSFVKHYFDHFNMDYLFIWGDINPKFSSRDTGQLYLIELPFLLAGVYFLLKRKDKTSALIFSWLILGLIPAATARETPHALRTLVSLPTWQIIIGCGIFSILKHVHLGGVMASVSLQPATPEVFKQPPKGVFTTLIIFILYFFSIFYFFHNYYIHYPKEFSGDWQYGYQEAVDFVKSVEGSFDEVWVTNQYGRPYIFFLFYGKYEPEFFWRTGKVRVDEFGFYHVDGFGKYKFGKFDFSKTAGKKILLIGAPGEISKEYHWLKKIDFLSGRVAFEIAEVK